MAELWFRPACSITEKNKSTNPKPSPFSRPRTTSSPQLGRGLRIAEPLRVHDDRDMRITVL
jgi:hypothetical protein